MNAGKKTIIDQRQRPYLFCNTIQKEKEKIANATRKRKQIKCKQ